MQTPEKRIQSSPCKSPSTKDVISGYLLYVGPISKGDAPSYSIQVQTSEDNVVNMKGYNVSLHKTLLGYEKKGERIKMDVRKYHKGYTLGSYCKVYKASPSEVDFQLNTSLKENILAGKVSRAVTMAELKRIDPTMNTESFLLKVKVNFGPNELEDIRTVYGETKVKRDIVLQDSTGNFPMQLFQSKLALFKDGGSYEIDGCLLKKLQGAIFIGIHAETNVKSIPPIQGLTTPTGFATAATVAIEYFQSIKDIKVFYTCPSCKKNMYSAESKAKWITCTTPDCNTESRVLGLDLQSCCDVKFVVEEKEVWAHVFNDVLKKCLGKIVSVDQVNTYLKSLEDFRVVLLNQVVKDIIVGKDDDPPGTTGKDDGDDDVSKSGEKKGVGGGESISTTPSGSEDNQSQCKRLKTK